MLVGTAQAQPFFDCSCLATQSVLFTNACCGFIPDLCPAANNCYFPPAGSVSGYTCSQLPLPGTPVCSNTPISFTITDIDTLLTTNCNVTFYVGFSTNRFSLICPTNQILPCNSTNFPFSGPIGWTNVPLCCTNPVTILGPSFVTNWPVISATWIGMVCGVVDVCQASVMYGGPPPVTCPCLNLTCPSNIIVQVCTNNTAGFGVTNVFYPLPVVSNSCIGVVTNLACTPAPGSSFPVGTNTVTCVVQDNLGNSATCAFDVIVLGDTDPPAVICPPLTTVQCGSGWTPTPPSAVDLCCGTNVFVMMQNIFTNPPTGPCLETIFIDWHITDCNGNVTNCTEIVNIVDTNPPVILCNSNQTAQCGGTAAGGGWIPTPPTAFDACCPTPPIVSLVGMVTNTSAPCNTALTLTWMAEDCCSNITYCTEFVTLVDTNPPVLNCQPFKLIECGSGPNWFGDYPTAFDQCCGTNVTITLVNVITNIVGPSCTTNSYTLFWTATDCCTNTSPVCVQQLRIVDTTPPNLVCGTNKTVQCGTPWNFDPPTATDNCCTSAPTVIVLSTTTNVPANCPTTITRTWQATDCCGNSTNCSQTVTEVDTIPPVIVCGPNITVQCGTSWSFSPATATDNCCIVSTAVFLASTSTNNTGACSETIEAVWEAVDCCGNKAFCTNYVNVVDTLPPAIFCSPSNRIVQCGAPLPPPSASDLCCGTNVTVSILSITTNFISACSNQLVITWQATDCCTNTATCVETNLMIDTTPPVITCAPSKQVQCGSGWTFDTPTAVDACCGTNVTISILGTGPVIGTLCKSTQTRTWQATDCCGNTAVCSQTVTVVDTTPPVITCGSNFTVSVGTPWAFTTPAVTDACCSVSSIVVVPVITTTNINLANPCLVVYTRTWKATDCCGNSATCSQSVSVLQVPPVNDPCTSPLPITVNAPYICGTTVCATPSLPGSLIPSPCGASLNAPDVWYTVTAVCTGPMTVDTCAPCPGYPTFDTVVSVYTNCNPSTQLPGGCNNNNTACGLQAKVTFNAVAGQTYRIRVSGASGAIGWFAIRAVQTVTLPPTNDLCANAIAVTVGSYCGSTICATPSLPGSIPTPCGSSVNTPDVWYTFTPNCNGPITINTCGTCIPCALCAPNPQFNTVLSVYSGQCSSFSQIACNNNATAGPCAGSQQSQVTFPGVAGVTNYIRVSGAGATTVGLFQLNISQAVATPPPNDLCANATPITAGTYAWNNCGALTDGPPNACQPLQDVWFKFTAPCAGQVWLNTCGSAIDTVMSVYTNTCANLGLVGCNDNAAAGNGPCGGSVQSFLTFNAVAGQTYHVRLGSPGAITGAGMLTLVGPNPTLGTCPPAVGPTFCRWYRIVGNPNCIPWGWSINSPCCANVANTNVPPVCSGDANTLAAAFAASINAACSGIGLSATAAPLPPPKQGRFQICTTCGNLPPFTLSVGAAGVLPQNLCVVPAPGGFNPVPVGWCSFNPDIEEIPQTGRDDNHNGVDDGIDIDLGTSQDENGNLIPDEVENCFEPELTSQPEPQAVQIGDTLSLSASASGSALLNFRWKRNGSPLSDGGNVTGATSNVLTITGITEAQTGSYGVAVTNNCGGLESEPVAISLAPTTLPLLYDLNASSGVFLFTVDTQIGCTYEVEYKDDLNDLSWTTMAIVPGTGGAQVIYDSGPPSQTRYFRVKQTCP